MLRLRHDQFTLFESEKNNQLKNVFTAIQQRKSNQRIAIDMYTANKKQMNLKTLLKKSQQ